MHDIDMDFGLSYVNVFFRSSSTIQEMSFKRDRITAANALAPIPHTALPNESKNQTLARRGPMVLGHPLQRARRHRG